MQACYIPTLLQPLYETQDVWKIFNEREIMFNLEHVPYVQVEINLHT